MNVVDSIWISSVICRPRHGRAKDHADWSGNYIGGNIQIKLETTLEPQFIFTKKNFNGNIFSFSSDYHVKIGVMNTRSVKLWES